MKILSSSFGLFAVMSAVNGLSVAFPSVPQGYLTFYFDVMGQCCESFVISSQTLILVFVFCCTESIAMVAIILLLTLFSVQGLGTGKVKYFFAPLLCLWFVAIAAIGIYNIVKYDPTIFRAFNPAYIYYFFASNKMNACYVLGGLVLCISGYHTNSLSRFGVNQVLNFYINYGFVSQEGRQCLQISEIFH